MPQSDYAITVHAINKHYGSYHAVRDLSFDVQREEIFAMLGPNGAGKTSTIRMILDILKPDSGQISVLGKPFTEETKNLIGYLPEERGLYRSVKLVDMLTYLGQLKGMHRQDAQRKSVELLERVGLGDHIKSKVSELSRGMAQKVQFVATILHSPELIVIDEPFSGLDPVNTQVMKDLLFELRAGGTTIVMSTHQMHQVEAMADRMLMVAEGQRVLYGPVKEVRSQYAQNAVIVEGEGDWARLAGVVKVSWLKNHTFRLQLADNITSSTIMATLAQNPDYHITRFEVDLPGLDEIFIQVAGQPTEPADA